MPEQIHQEPMSYVGTKMPSTPSGCPRAATGRNPSQPPPVPRLPPPFSCCRHRERPGKARPVPVAAARWRPLVRRELHGWAPLGQRITWRWARRCGVGQAWRLCAGASCVADTDDGRACPGCNSQIWPPGGASWRPSSCWLAAAAARESRDRISERGQAGYCPASLLIRWALPVWG